MYTMAVSSLLSSDGLTLLIARSSQPKLDQRSGHVQFRTARRSFAVTAAATSTSTSTNNYGLESREVTPVPSTDFCKGWNDANGLPQQRTLSQLESLAATISDRTEMHTILALQRDNWSRLFHSSITIASVSAAAASAMNGAIPSLGLHVVSIILGMGAAMLMALVSKFQPSQLAEEQRHAARFFKRLGADIEFTLQEDPRLRADAVFYWEQKVGTLHALDKAFPLPLTPIVLEKFPKQVRPSNLSGELDLSEPEIQLSRQQLNANNGWTSAAVDDLKRTAELLRTSDIPEYVNMANNTKIINLVLAITSPLFATAGAVLNMAGCPSVAAAFTVGSLFAHTLSHGLQMGAVFEVYRNCAGYYADVEKSIEGVVRLPVQKREDATIFFHRISMLLGRTPSLTPMVPLKEEKAGILF